ncbi:hypothetical protein CTI12_AA038580 [Artemisia annua]|uniref:Reverse transcriptase zinc-binding domain-containing protein n=1 Tax=Artemisia annua TaxID=35608 RepID=A0A2U1QF13_ARTAN|nr:hypothetical protein CTI12_AA038580 [Artemisia annua]
MNVWSDMFSGECWKTGSRPDLVGGNVGRDYTSRHIFHHGTRRYTGFILVLGITLNGGGLRSDLIKMAAAIRVSIYIRRNGFQSSRKMALLGALQVLMLEACNLGVFRGIVIGDDEVNVSLLQYADDALIFGEWSPRKNLISILKGFGDASGLKVNVSKSNLYGVRRCPSEVMVTTFYFGKTFGYAQLRYGFEDGLLWNLDQHHSFSVKKLASLIDSNILKDHCFGRKSHAWSSLVPKKINIHIWRLATNRLPLLPKLLRLGINVTSVMCPLCNEVPESIEHIMVHCPKVNTIWMKCFRWWGLNPSYKDLSIKSLIDGIFCTHLPKIAQSVFVGVCYSAFWAIWRWRNKITNRNSKINVDWKTWVFHPMRSFSAIIGT